MKTLTTPSTLLFMVLAACGSVPPSEPPADEPPADPDAPEPTPDPTQPVVSPLVIETPGAATGPASIFRRRLSSPGGIADLIVANAIGYAQIVETRLVTKTAEPIELTIELPPPTGTAARVLVTDNVELRVESGSVGCVHNGTPTGDPRCVMTQPPSELAADMTPLGAGSWAVTVLDEQTGIPVSSCHAQGELRLACSLPGKAAATYRVVVSARNFAGLWDGSPDLGDWELAGTAFTGALQQQDIPQCMLGVNLFGEISCKTWRYYTRYKGIDEARLELDPMTLTITANGVVTTATSPALTWDAGNSDLPGATY